MWLCLDSRFDLRPLRVTSVTPENDIRKFASARKFAFAFALSLPLLASASSLLTFFVFIAVERKKLRTS